MRVAGTDPGTSSLDLLVLNDGQIESQIRFDAADLQVDPTAPIRWFEEQGPIDLIVGPSGYGVPLIESQHCTEAHFDQMVWIRPEERGQNRGIGSFSKLLRSFVQSQLPVVFVPGVIHLPTVPIHRKYNRIDCGTPDKLCVAVLAIHQFGNDFCLLELGSAFNCILIVQNGQIVHGLGGTSGIPGWQSSGSWDGEAAYFCSPISKKHLFEGGFQSIPENEARSWFVEEVTRALIGLAGVHRFPKVVLSGRFLEMKPDWVASVTNELQKWITVELLPSISGSWVKHAAQGAALLAEGLLGGPSETIVNSLRIRESQGTIFDYLLWNRLG